MAYPVPVDVGAVTDVSYHLICIPDDPAYRQAALDAYTRLADSWRWGMEETAPDAADIEQQWLSAIDITLEFWMTNPLQTIIDYIDEVETLLKALKNVGACCPDPQSYLPKVDVPDAGYTYDGETFPETWGDGEEVADLADYQEILCGAAHTFVDYLAGVGAQLDTMVAVGGVIVGSIAAILGIMSGLGIVLVIEYGLVAGAVTQLVASATTLLFTTASTAIEDARADIVCAFLSGDGATLAAAVEDEVSALSYSLFWQYINYQDAINVAQTGTYGAETIDVRRSTDCECAEVYDFEIEAFFDSTILPWIKISAHSQSFTWYATHGGSVHSEHGANSGIGGINDDYMATTFGLVNGDRYRITKVIVDYSWGEGDNGVSRTRCEILSDGAHSENDEILCHDKGSEFTDHEFTFTPYDHTIVTDRTGYGIKMHAEKNGGTTNVKVYYMRLYVAGYINA